MTENRLKFRVYDIKRKIYFNDPVPPLNSDGTLAFQSSRPDFQKYYITEFCTGLSDKIGNLIYEGDVVLGASGSKYCIIWSEMELGWALQNLKTRLCIAMNAFMLDEIEIIGNIHEQKD